MSDDELVRAAYDAGLACGRTFAGVLSDCPFDLDAGLPERIAWLSGFRIGHAVKLKSL